MRTYSFLKLISLSVAMLLLCWLASPRVFSRGQEADSELAGRAGAILQARCLQCHGEEKMSGLDLRTREGALKGGLRGPALVPGDGAGSLLYKMVAGVAKPVMPLGQQLGNEEAALLKSWIEKGAAWPKLNATENRSTGSTYAPEKTISAEDRKYWAFRPPVRPLVPKAESASSAAWIRNPIDAFVLARLREKNLTPSPRADKRTLLRRVTLDLTGLPPTPAEMRAFLSDKTPGAYEKVVARLLASPHYGERWAQHWLDVVRFAETNGYELDQEREQAWRYRDYVVRSYNEDKPYQRFLVEQLAGDELAPADFEMRVATGFLRAGPQHVVAGNQDLAVNRQEWLTEATAGVSNAFLGLTVGCARCHNHKFDPILQADYYRLQSFFAATDNHDYKSPTAAEREAHERAVGLHKARLKPITDQIAAIEKPYRDRLTEEKRRKLEPIYLNALAVEEKERTPEQKRLAQDARRMLKVEWDELVASLAPADRERRAALRRQMHAIELEAPAPLPAALGVAETLNPVPATHILRGGDPHAPGEEVRPRFLSVLLRPDAPSDETPTNGRRTALARWLADPAHPLVARVMVNRLWQHHFGRGIVATPNDFGRNGQQPTHPELLDWLATEFVARGGSLKAMHALMVLSSTYQQSSAPDPAKVRADPDNLLLWRMNRQRLDAEALRDSILATAGVLNKQVGGPPIRVPLEPEVYDTIFTEGEPDNLWPVTPDARQHTRRSLYLLRKRNVRLPMLVAFDAPDLMSSCAARGVSVHSLQALTLLNSEFMFQQSQSLARRLFRESPEGGRQRIRHLYALVLGRPPRPRELRAAESFVKEQTAIIRERRHKNEPFAQVAGLPPGVDPAEAAAWVDLCLASFNLNEFVYID